MCRSFWKIADPCNDKKPIGITRMSGLKMITHGWPGLEINFKKSSHRSYRKQGQHFSFEGAVNLSSFVGRREKTNREHQQRVLNWWVLEKKRGDVWPLKYSTKSSNSRIRRTRAINLIVGEGKILFFYSLEKNAERKEKTRRRERMRVREGTRRR
jgi:hypothetical protein